MDLGIFKLLMGLTLVLMTFIGGLLPLKLESNVVIMSLGNVLSSGVFLGTGLLHMIPEASEDLNDTIDEKWKLAYLLAGAGLLTIVIFEELVVVWQRRLAYRHLEQKIGGYTSATSSFVARRYSARRSARLSTRSHISHVSFDDSDASVSETKGLIDDHSEAECASIIAQTVVESLYPRSCLIHHPFLLSPPPPFEVDTPTRSQSLPSSLNGSPNSSPRASAVQPNVEHQNQICAPQPHFHYIPETKTIECQHDDHHHHHQHSHNHSGKPEGSIDMKNPVSNQKSPVLDIPPEKFNKPSARSKAINDDDSKHDGHDHGVPKELLGDDESDSPYLAYVLVMALSVHSFFEAAALGSSTDFSGAISLWVAISAHKVLSSFALGSSLLRADVSRRTLLKLLACFCATTVIGIVLGYLLTEGTQASTADFISGCANAFAAGTFFYIGLCDILPKELSTVASTWVVFAKLGCFVFGFSAMSCLSIFFG